MQNDNNSVCISNVEEYNPNVIYEKIKEHFKFLNLNEEYFSGKNVVIKPNLVSEKAPEKHATTHPSIVYGIVKILNDYGVCPTIAESPSGVYKEQRLRNLYKVCGLTDILKNCNCILNEDVSYERIDFKNGQICKQFDIITPIANADIVIDACKLKSHALTTMTGAIKNMFGCIPGVEKFEQHASHPGHEEFAKLIVDITQGLYEMKDFISVTDAIIGMEGEGPTAGEVRKIGAIISSRNPFANDLLSEHILGLDGEVYMVKEGKKRGLIPNSIDELCIIGDNYKEIIIDDFKLCESVKSPSIKFLKSLSNHRFARLFMPTPFVTDKCVGCKTCINNCPQKTIEYDEKNRKAKIKAKNCIRCYCCQETCPFEAIKIKRNIILAKMTKNRGTTNV